MEILTCCAFYYFLFQLFTNPKLGYVKETPPKEEENEGTVGSVLPVKKGLPEDSEGDEHTYNGLRIWL